MHLNGVDLNLLIALDALLQEKNVTRAGERIFLSQSAMSGALARLRDHYEDPLLVRVGRTMVLTPVAESLAHPVRSVLTQMEAVLEVKPSFVPALSKRTFRVMASDYGSIVLLAGVLERISDAAPGVSVEIVSFSDSLLDGFEQGNIDLLILAKSFVSATHPSADLLDDRYVVICWAENSLISDSISIEQLVSMGHVLVKYGTHGTAHIEEKFFQSCGYARRAEVVATSFSAVPHFVVGTNRVAVMLERLAQAYAQWFPLKILPPPVTDAGR